MTAFPLVTVVVEANVQAFFASNSSPLSEIFSGSKYPSISCGIYSGRITTRGSTFAIISFPQVTIVVVANILALAVAFTVE